MSGLQILPSDGDAELTGGGGGGGGGKDKPAFSFDNDTTMNLDGPGYALSLLLIGEIVILAMAFFSGGLGFGGRSFSENSLVRASERNISWQNSVSIFQFPIELSPPDLGQGLEEALSWLADLSNLQSGRMRRTYHL